MIPSTKGKQVFKRGRAEDWTRDRLQGLDRHELLQLQANAERLSEPELAALCVELLKEKPLRGRPNGGPAKPKLRGLMSRTKAFEARGVFLMDVRTSWSGVRKADGMVVFALWAAAVQSQQGGCRCLLWAPNRDGDRAWSESGPGRERREHCELAIRKAEEAEGLLVHGQAMEGRLPEDRARSVQGIDPETVIRLRVEKSGDEYWAAWGKSTAS
jgi:hypothetical protein